MLNKTPQEPEAIVFSLNIFEKGSGRGTALGDGHPIKIACFPRLEPGMIEVPAAFEPLQVHQVVV